MGTAVFFVAGQMQVFGVLSQHLQKWDSSVLVPSGVKRGDSRSGLTGRWVVGLHTSTGWLALPGQQQERCVKRYKLIKSQPGLLFQQRVFSCLLIKQTEPKVSPCFHTTPLPEDPTYLPASSFILKSLIFLLTTSRLSPDLGNKHYGRRSIHIYNSISIMLMLHRFAIRPAAMPRYT